MNKHLAPLALILALGASPAPAKPDMGKILDRLADAGAQVVQQADELPSPIAAVKQELSAIKEAYKEEGRAYARELGDIMMERAMANKKVDRTLDSVRALCWGVVAYITVISLLLFAMMLRIQSLLKKAEKRQDEQER
ncbi:MAG: hypothetical protein MJ051_01865 [Akkermansia sp.]|nr:hypothetical protein [Akkermansia sp.]